MSIKAWWNSKSTTEKIETVFKGIVAAVVGGGSIICIHEVRKSKDILNYAIQSAADGVEIEISDELIRDAAEKATNDQIRRTVKTVVDRTWRDIQNETNEKVSEAVKDARRQITESVSAKMAEECRKINEQDILREIREQATEKLTEKLDKNLDAITDEYSKNLSNMGKVYEALAEKLQSKA